MVGYVFFVLEFVVYGGKMFYEGLMVFVMFGLGCCGGRGLLFVGFVGDGSGNGGFVCSYGDGWEKIIW